MKYQNLIWPSLTLCFENDDYGIKADGVDFSLTIFSAKVEDDAVWKAKCEGKEIEAKIIIKEDPPKFTEPLPEEKRFKTGQDEAVLECQVNFLPLYSYFNPYAVGHLKN